MFSIPTLTPIPPAIIPPNLFGLLNDDTFVEGAGFQVFDGGLGNDVMKAGTGASHFDGGVGNDTVDYSNITTGVTVDLGNGFADDGGFGDTFVSVENAMGSSFDDVLIGSSVDNYLFGGDGNDQLSGLDGDDLLIGGAGDDTLEGGVGDDTLDGGAGFDTASYASSNGGVEVSLAAGRGIGGHASDDKLLDIEGLIGSQFRDNLSGDNGDNAINGGAGDDFIFGLGGDDYLVGGSGADTFAFSNSGPRNNPTESHGFDIIADFQVGLDVINLAATNVQDYNDLTNGGNRAMYNGSIVFDDGSTATGVIINTINGDDGDGIFVQGVTVADLQPNSFDFDFIF